MTSASQGFADLTLNNEMDTETPGGGETLNPYAGVVIEDLVLASTHCWMKKGTRHVVTTCVKKGFTIEKIKTAAQKLTEVGHVFVNRQGGGIRSKVDLFIDDILNVLYNLDERGNLPKIIVSSDELPMMPLYAMTEGDSVEVSTRLGSMEKELSDLKNAVCKIASGGFNTPPAPQVVIDGGE